MPQVSIVIRAFNEERLVGRVLSAIREQDYNDYEVILVDSGSTDRTLDIAAPLCDKVLQIDSRDFTFGFSLNVGCRHAQGERIVMLSAHAIPAGRHWLRALLSPFAEPQVGMVFGRHIGAAKTKFSESRDFAHFFPPRSLYQTESKGVYANNANSALRRILWEEHPFDEYLSGLEDIAWAQYVTGRDYAIVYQPDAAVYHIHDETWAHIYNRYRREAIAARRLGLPHPPHGPHTLGHTARNVSSDVFAALSSRPTVDRLKEIIGFRYYQWRGSRDGWREPNVDLDRERYALYFSGANDGVVIQHPHHAAIQEIPIPEVKPGDVLIKVDFVGVCRTDLEVYEGTLGYYKRGLASYPIVPGHEFSGHVVRVGANGQRFRVGDSVVGECIIPCGTCAGCATGVPTACLSRREVGVVNYNGAYARFISLPAVHVHKVPDGLDSKVAVLTEPLAVVRKAIRRVGNRLRGGDRCAVVGAGPIGNLTTQVLTFFGCEVTVFDINEARLRSLDGKWPTGKHPRDLDTFNLIVEATGQVEVLRDILAESRADATILLLGFPYGSTEFNFESVVAKERCIIGSVGSHGEDFDWALEHLSNLDTTAFTQHVVPLAGFQEAWQTLRRGDQLKVLLQVE